MPELGQYRPDGREGAYDSDRWWPAGLPEWIGKQVEAGDEVLIALDKGLRSFGWPAYNVPQPLPREDSWPGIALALAQRIREARGE
jgi:hypothetical protein